MSPTVPEYVEHHESIQKILKFIDTELLSIPVEESKGNELAVPLQPYNIVVNGLKYTFIPGGQNGATQVTINDNWAWLMMDAQSQYQSVEHFHATCQSYLKARGLLSTDIPEQCAGCASIKAMCIMDEKKCPQGYPLK